MGIERSEGKMRMTINDIHTLIDVISENGILSSIVGSIIVAIIAIISKLPTRIMNQIGKLDGIYEGNAEDLVCDNDKPYPNMLYIIRVAINRSLSRSDYKIDGCMDVWMYGCI